ncbi:bifunctional DNA primase/polymerase [Nostoc muscorum FACHB-395]|nr:bifunctional DNA primase/polymerase [Desmonostoc muscorum FACHB-395]
MHDLRSQLNTNLKTEQKRSQDNLETFLHSSIENSQKLDGTGVSQRIIDRAEQIIYSPDPEKNLVIHELLELGVSPMPVAPKQDPRRTGYGYKFSKDNENPDPAKRKYDRCELEGDCTTPVTLFGGKNPSFLEKDRKPRFVKHRSYQDALPTSEELAQWFVNPDTGVGAMCGMSDIYWIDIDKKTFDSAEDCDTAATAIINKLGQCTWIERTGSGGWRVAVRLDDKPGYTNFALEENGKHRGEVLGHGRYTVLAPTIHPNGNPYERIGFGEIPYIDSLEELGIYPSVDEGKKSTTTATDKEHKQIERKEYKPGSFSIDPNAKPLHWYLAKEAKSLYKEGVGDGGRNNAVFKLAAQLLGAKNDLDRLGIPFTGDPYEMALEFGSRCNPPMDDYEIDTCFNSADSRDCVGALPDEILVAIAGGGSKTKAETKSKPTPEEDALQLELERQLYHDLSKIDFKKCEELGIKVTFIEKSHTEFSPSDLNIEKNKISIISSGMGTGKSVNTGKGVIDYSCLYSWYSRRVLAQSAAKTLDLTYIDDLNKDTKNRNRLSFCSQRSYQQSLTPMRSDGALVIDECDDVFDYNFEELCNRDNIRPMILKSLEAQLEAALHNGTAVFMSADVSQKEIDYILAIAPKGTPIELVVNTYQMPKGKCYFSTDASPEGLVEKIAELVRAGEAVYLLDDFKNGYKGCKTLSEYIRQQMPGLSDSAFRTIHGDNSGSHENRDYIDDINESSLNTTLMCVSPSVVQGVSLENGRFKHVFAIINGILTDKKVTQGISRVRGVENTYIWVAEKGVNKRDGDGITAGDINNHYQRNYNARNIYLHSYGITYNVIKDEWNSPHWELRCKNVAYNNLVMRRLRYWVQARLEGLGYELIPTEFGNNKDLDLQLKDLWKGIGVIEAKRIGDANVLDKADKDKLVAKIKRGESLSPKERDDMAKTHIHEMFGEELVKKTYVEASLNAKTVSLTGYAAVAYKNRDRKFERNLMRNYRLFHGGAEEAAQRDIAKEKAQEKVGEKFVGDIKWSLREFKMWELFDIKKYFEPMKKYTPLDFYTTFTQMQELAPHIKDAGWVDISEKNCGTVFGELLHDFGYETEARQITASDGKRVRERWITQESFDYVAEFCKYQLAKNNMDNRKDETPKTAAHPPHTLLINLVFDRGGVQGTQNITQQDLQPLCEASKLDNSTVCKLGGVQDVKKGVCSSDIDSNLCQQETVNLSPTDKMMARISTETQTTDTELQKRFLARVAAIKAKPQPQYNPDMAIAF